MATVKDQLLKMQSTVQEALVDADKFEEKGNHAAGVRVRAAMQDLKKGAQEVRSQVTEKTKADKANKGK